MELNLGSSIKKLRTEKGMTQEELSQYLGVSFQAVSKWENDTTMPDIALLPRLALFFGVRIDDLFAIDRKDELERIDHILSHEKMTDQNFVYAKQTLDAILRDRPDDAEAIKRYAGLYLAKNNRDALAAGRLLEHAMSVSPTDPEIYTLYRQIRGGDRAVTQSANDWFIRVCEPYARQHPQNVKLYELLVEAMIDMRYFERAEELAALMQPDEATLSCLKVIWQGDIALAKGNTERAKGLWQTVDRQNHKGQYEVGERFCRIHEYDMAIACFQHSFAAASVPRDLSAVYSLAFLYTKLARFREAADTWQLILDVLAQDHHMIDGETVAWARREWAQCRARL